MTQRLDTKIGTQGGLETNVQADQSTGYQIADNVIYRPIGGISKRRGAKKLVETVTGETKRLVSPTQDGAGVLSIQEVDSTGEAKVLGYKKTGFQVDFYSLINSKKVLLTGNISNVVNYDKIRFEFDNDVYEDDNDFIENAFDGKLSVFNGFFDATLTFNTVAVEQDSIDSDLLRVSKFVNLPTKNAEIVIEGSNSLLTAPTLVGTYDIVSVSDDFFTIYPTSGAPAPAWTSTGDTGTINFTFQTFRVIEVDEIALKTTNLIGYLDNKIFFERLGSVPNNFSIDEIVTCLEDRSGDEIVFNSNLGQMYFSDENPDEPKVSYYGSHAPLDVIPYYFTNISQYGCLKEQTRYAYCAVLKKEINDQTFVSSPSPTFYIETANESSNYVTAFSASIEPTTGQILLEITGVISADIKFVQLKNVTSTPPIPDGTQFRADEVIPNSPRSLILINVESQIATLGAQVTAISAADVLYNRNCFCDVALNHAFWQDYIRDTSSLQKYFVQLYRTFGVDTSSTPDISQFFLVKEKQLTEVYDTPNFMIKDDEIYDADLESQLPLYTNPTEEGVLKENSIAPQHQNFIEKNGVFYLGDLKKQEIKSKQKIISISSSSSVGYSSIEVVGGTYDHEIIELTLPIQYDYFDTAFQNLTSLISDMLGFNSLNFNGFFCLLYVEDSIGSEPRSKPVFITNNGISAEMRDLENNIIVPAYDYVLTPLYYPDTGSSELKTLGYNPRWYGDIINGTPINFIYLLSYRAVNLAPSIPYNVSEIYPSYTELNAGTFYTQFFGDPFTSNNSTNVNFSIQTRDFFQIDLPISIPNIFDENLPSLGVEPFRYQIAYSKPFEPAAFPVLQFLNVGSTRNVIYGIFKVRDSLIIASKEGFYRLTGDNELDYVISLIESDTAPLTPLLMTEQQDRVLALTQKGLAACTESNVQIIDTAIQDITERFLQLYRDDLDSFTVRQTYTAAPRFLNQVVFYMPTLKERDTSKSTFGLSFDTTYQRFSTVDLYVNDEEKNGVLSNAFDASRFSNESYSVPSFQPSSLQAVRAEVTRSDFAQNECFIELGTFWQATGSIAAGSSILTITTSLDHRLQAGDYVTLIFGEAFVTTASGLPASLFDSAVYLVDVSGADPKVLTVGLGFTSGSDVTSQEVRFRFGRSGLPVTLSLTTGSPLCSLTLASQADVGWLVGQKLVIQKPYGAPLNSIEPLLTNIKNIVSVSSLQLQITLPTNSPITTSSPAIISEDLRDPYKQTFSFVAPIFDNQKDFGLLERNSRLLYPFESEDKGSRIQGFLERPWDSQWKPDRPSKIFDGVQSTLMTARITGGDPCSLKNFGQFIVTMQSIFSMSKVNLSFQGDRYDAVQGVSFRSQNSIDAPFDPAFADVLWSTIAQQWASITNPNAGWKEGAPFTPIRVTTPNNVSQSTYLSIFLRHDRPFETFALGSMAVNGTFIDPTSAGV